MTKLQQTESPPTQPRDDKRHPLKPWTLEEIQALEQTRWLCGDDERPILMADATWLIMGLMKNGKTFFAMELAFCVAFGLPFLGIPTEQGNVVYVIAEGGVKRIFEKRVAALYEKHKLALEDQFLSSLEEVWETGNFRLVGHAVDLVDGRNKVHYTKLIEQIGDKPVAAVFLDTWARMLSASGGHDSDAETVGPALDGADAIKNALGCTVVIVAHIGVSKGAQNRPKGLSNLANNIDGGLKAEKHGEGNLAVFEFTTEFQRFSIDGFKLEAMISNFDTSFGKGQALVTIGPKTPESLSERAKRMIGVLDELRGAEGAPVKINEWKKAVLKNHKDQFAEDQHSYNGQWRRAIKELKEVDAVKFYDNDKTAMTWRASDDFKDEDTGADE